MSTVRESRAPSQLPVYTDGPRRWSGFLIFLGVVALAIVIAVVVVTHLSHQGSTGSLTPVPVAGISGLNATGVEQGGAFEAGNPVTLAWTDAHPAGRYRIQVETASGSRPGSPSLILHSVMTRTTRSTSYVLHVPSAGVFYWRVQAFRHGHWNKYTTAQRFVMVPRPLAKPVPLSPRNGAYVGSSPRLCWTRVAHATGYYVWVPPNVPQPTARACATIHLTPGAHVWRVAAFVQGSHSFVSRYSNPARLIVGTRPRGQHLVGVSHPRSQRHVRSHPAPTAVPAPVQAQQPVQVAPQQPVQQPAPYAPYRQNPVAPSVPAPQPHPVTRPVIPQAPPSHPAPAPATGKSNCIPMFTC